MSLASRVIANSVLAWSNYSPLERPDRFARAVYAARPYGSGIVAAVAASTARYPSAPAVIDPDGTLSYWQLWQRSERLGRALINAGARHGTTIGLLGRNHRGFVVAMIAAAKTGADLVFLNTEFAGPQLADVVAAEGIDLVLHDDEFTPVVEGCGARAYGAGAQAAMANGRGVVLPRRTGRLVVLTSGTTGRPKGAARSARRNSAEGVAGVLARVPFRVRDTQVVAAPLFHSWGLSSLVFGFVRAATTVLTGRFDPAAVLAATAGHRADVLIVVPVMLQRILDLGGPALAAADTSRLRVIAASGSALPRQTVVETLNRFGPVLYNLYGSTEVAVASVATPADLRRRPDTAGRPILGVRVEILDADGRPVKPGETGRVFVGNPGRFDGYTGGGGKEQRRGLLSSGDLGHFEGRLLFVDGRDDDMIVSGGENVFPLEVEQLLSTHPKVAEVSVVGVSDAAFGQGLAAFVVARPDCDLTADEVRSYVRERLARYKVPRRVELLEELPRTATGKVLKRELVKA